jgi:hypothetical protein
VVQIDSRLDILLGVVTKYAERASHYLRSRVRRSARNLIIESNIAGNATGEEPTPLSESFFIGSQSLSLILAKKDNTHSSNKSANTLQTGLSSPIPFPG